jgi:hypothetical protein
MEAHSFSRRAIFFRLPQFPTKPSIFYEAVIPAKAGIQPLPSGPKSWIPAFAGMTSKG